MTYSDAHHRYGLGGGTLNAMVAHLAQSARLARYVEFLTSRLRRKCGELLALEKMAESESVSTRHHVLAQGAGEMVLDFVSLLTS